MTAFGLIVFGLAAMSALAASCESLASLVLPSARITLAQPVPAGSFSPPGGGPGAGRAAAANPYQSLPEFCRVAATLIPTADSDIKIEVWLPSAGWNRKFQAVGNGGWAGTISYSAMAEAVRQGYATASTDTGHSSAGGAFVLGHPEKLIDFGWRSEHEMTVKAKAIVQAFYGSAARRSYWNGCSTGGRQGLQEAQKFPDDFDGIIAGAPANRTALGLWVAAALLADPASFIPPHKYSLIHTAALDACDAGDGVKDGLIENPETCKFDPGVLLCKGADNDGCLTAPQVEAARKVYGPGRNPRSGAVLFPALAPGSEPGWGVLGGGPEPYANALDQYRYVVFQDPRWDWRTFNFDSDIVRSERPEYLVMNATDPDLKRFFAHSGKLLMYHGWADPNVSPYNTIRYFRAVQDTMGGPAKTAGNIRLFMAPGMGHCGGGEGPNVFDKVTALDHWVEVGKAPDSIIATHRGSKPDRTRPLCPYPQVAVYKRSGSIDDAASFACRQP